MKQYTQNTANLRRLLSDTLRLMRNGLSRIRNLVLHRLSSLRTRSLQATAVHEDTADLDDTNTSQEEVDGGETTRILDISFMKGGSE